jgi:hypothetical protein
MFTYEYFVSESQNNKKSKPRGKKERKIRIGKLYVTQLCLKGTNQWSHASQRNGNVQKLSIIWIGNMHKLNIIWNYRN